MNTIRTYFQVQMKRIFKMLPAFLLATLLMYGCIGFLALIYMNSSQADERAKYQIGIVGELSDSRLGFGFYALQAMDASRKIVEFQFVTEQEARERLQKGELNSYVRIPDGFMESIENGTNDRPVEGIAAEGEKGIASIFMEEMTNALSVMISHAQGAVYGMQELLSEYGRESIWEEAAMQINLRYVELALNRTELCNLELTGMSNGLSLEGGLLCGILLFFIMLSGLNSSAIFSRRSRELSGIMAARGVGEHIQVMGEYLAYVVLMVICLAEICLISYVGLKISSLQIAEWNNMCDENPYIFYLSLLLAVAMLAAMQFLLYELATGLVGSILLQFVSSIAMAYLSGFFYPSSFFPDAVQCIGELLPTGVALNCVQNGLLGTFSVPDMLGVFLYLLLFVGASVLVRKYRAQKG